MITEVYLAWFCFYDYAHQYEDLAHIFEEELDAIYWVDEDPDNNENEREWRRYEAKEIIKSTG